MEVVKVQESFCNQRQFAISIMTAKKILFFGETFKSITITEEPKKKLNLVLFENLIIFAK